MISGTDPTGQQMFSQSLVRGERYTDAGPGVGGHKQEERRPHFFFSNLQLALEVQNRPTNLKQGKDEEIHIIVKCLQTKDKEKTFKTCE